MSDFVVTLPRGLGTVRDSAEAAFAPQPTVVRFRNANGEQVGETITPKVSPPIPVEVFAPDGSMGWKEYLPDVSLDVDPPEDAETIELEEPGREAAAFSIFRQKRPKPQALAQPERRSFGSSANGFALGVMAERYGQADRDLFFADVEALYHFLVGGHGFSGFTPFPEFANRFAIEALFWPSDPEVGLLDVRTDRTPSHWIFGDYVRALEFFQAAGGGFRRTLVLINLPLRGGAGGNDHYPAFTTNTGSDRDQWQRVAVHELGHAYGLGDEYVENPPSPVPGGREGNISASAEYSALPWRGMIDDPNGYERVGFQVAKDPHLPFRPVVGAFQGARYEAEGLYRSAPQCMMRDTRFPFCPVCETILRHRLHTGQATGPFAT